ncbi:MAG: hypothetical protein C4K60_20225 [Ideonella sp. MAG2]|nr:MAG: hypothetical protein C4K60_20225 [Ideonella sp. MAG2]
MDIWDGLIAASAFMAGLTLVRNAQRRHGRGNAVAGSAAPIELVARPANQVAVLCMDELVASSRTQGLLRGLEQRTRFSRAMFARDCLPVLEALADYVQMLPASECHHHAQPGGLWIHLLEVTDAALTFRAGIELPQGATTEERKRLEHRWTYGVFCAALLHDIGKPVTDLHVTLYAHEPRSGRPWAPLAGPMRAHGASHYSVEFVDASERDYQAHHKLGAMLLHQFVPARLIRWLSEEGDVLKQLLAYLSAESHDGPIGTLIKRADSDSVSRNLLHGPRTRFASARTQPLIERLMEALRRMLKDGGILPLNRPGAAGWVYEDSIWFVCARLADEVRAYLQQHESAQGLPGKDKNDRLFDTWQESGACLPAPEGGAVWRVWVQCETWRSPDALTVLRFPLSKLFAKPEDYPAAMNGCISTEPLSPATPCPAPAASTTAAPVLAPASPPWEFMAASEPIPTTQELSMPLPDLDPDVQSMPPADDGLLAPHEMADLHVEPSTHPAPHTGPALTLGSPLRPHQPSGPKPAKGATPAAEAFMAWVAEAVGTGVLKYNEEGALVHFAAEGCLLLSPEIFKRFIDGRREDEDGPIHALLQSHGDKAYARLQNELAKSGWTRRNGDENLHYYAFTKTDGSLSRVVSCYLLPQPELFWNPVPKANERLRAVARTKKAKPKQEG